MTHASQCGLLGQGRFQRNQKERRGDSMATTRGGNDCRGVLLRVLWLNDRRLIEEIVVLQGQLSET